MRLIIPSVLAAAVLGLVARAPHAEPFVPDAAVMGQANGYYVDPEFSESAKQAVFQDDLNRVWIGDLVDSTGLFRSATGRDYLVEDDSVVPAMNYYNRYSKWSTNGPEWARDDTGELVVYTKISAESLMQQWMARLKGGVAAARQLTSQPFDCYGNMPSRFPDGKPPRVAFTYNWPIVKARAAWIFLDKPGELHEVPGFDYRRMSIWSAVTPDFLFVYRPDTTMPEQVARSNTETGAMQVLTDEPGKKDDPGMFRAPEFGGEVCLVANIDNAALAVYRDLKAAGGLWTRVATLTLPADAPYKYISSPEPVAPATGLGGVSYFALLARQSANRNTPGSIWVLGLGTDANNRFARRVDDGAGSGYTTASTAVLMEPEPWVGKYEAYVYYNSLGLRRARTGIMAGTTGIGVGPQRRPVSVSARKGIPADAVSVDILGRIVGRQSTAGIGEASSHDAQVRILFDGRRAIRQVHLIYRSDRP